MANFLRVNSSFRKYLLDVNRIIGVLYYPKRSGLLGNTSSLEIEYKLEELSRTTITVSESDQSFNLLVAFFGFDKDIQTPKDLVVKNFDNTMIDK